jgi:hypothetical protein
MGDNKRARPADAGLSDEVQAAVTALVQSLEGAEKWVKQTLGEYRRLARAGSNADPFQLRTWLRKAGSMPLQAGVAEHARQLGERLDAYANDAILRLDADLRDACGRLDWKIDGQWPHYYVQRAIRIQIHEKEARADVGESIVPTLHVPALVKAVETEMRNLFPPGFDPLKFLAALAGAFGRLATPEQRGVPIWPLYREMLLSQQPRAFWRTGRASLFRPFAEQRFRAMLTALLERGATKTKDGRQLKLLPPLKAEEAMYLFLPAEQRFAYVGRVDFVSADPELLS